MLPSEFEIYRKRFNIKMSYSNINRFSYFQRLFSQIQEVNGDIVECGVGYGKSLLNLAYLIKNETKSRKLWGFDSFEGFQEENESKEHTKGKYKDITIFDIHNLLISYGLDAEFVKTQVSLIKGFFEDSLLKHHGEIALLHIDADLYESYKVVFKELYPKVAKGGIVAFDEYLGTLEHNKWPGAYRAINECIGNDILRDDATGKYYHIKK